MKIEYTPRLEMTPFIAALGQQVAGQAATGAVALGLQRIGANYDRRQQMKSAQQMQALQIAGEKEMMDYQQGIQMENWNNTSYEAQKEHMKNAGLNPALMYGMGGGGGQSMGTANASVAGQPAIDPKTREAQGMGILTSAQLDLMKAQAENLRADAQDKLANIPNRPLTGENIKADTQGKLQGINNAKAEEAYTKAKTQFQNYTNWTTEQTMDDAIKKFHAETNNAIDQAHITMGNAKVADATETATINRLKLEAINTGLDGMLKRKDKEIKTEQIHALKTTIYQMIEKHDYDLQKLMAPKSGNTEDKGTEDVISKLIEGIIGILPK